MAKKGVLSQGTHVWILHGDTPTLTKMDCIKALTLGDDSTTEISTTCLEEKTTATSDWGLTTPGEGSIQIDTDPKNLSHMKLLELAAERAEVGVYVGWSDGDVPPEITGNTVTLPEDRTWSSFRAILRKGSPVFDADALVNHTVPMKRQTEVIDVFKVATP
ncbi:phage tail tube protein [Acinetobacter pseudolwoffii]|uniref:phage tail tube protein n=1 Tax=Acinetobacter pseudolwoffii TaxID=2053287 RepID=UPI002468F9A7|nr:phage tail tube protein [Acinetobacter pseudolwoffii]MDH5819501.1 phage tail tube protein [Acinetobacter pseudolwoffii]